VSVKITNVKFLQTKEAAIKALVELDDQGGKDELINIKYVLVFNMPRKI
jgi:hypothetical protein